MKFLEVLRTKSGREVAYLFDETKGRVLKVWVEDMTQVDRGEEITYDADENEDERPPRRVQVNKPRNIMPPGIAQVFEPQGSPREAVVTRQS